MGLTDSYAYFLPVHALYQIVSIKLCHNGDIPKGGTMRLGAYPCRLTKGSRAARIYGEELIYERHRHRYEFNNEYRRETEKAGLRVCGSSPDGKLVEAVELSELPFYIGVQFHPEFKSRPNRPHPLFAAFVRECDNYQGEKENEDK